MFTHQLKIRQTPVLECYQRQNCKKSIKLYKKIRRPSLRQSTETILCTTACNAGKNESSTETSVAWAKVALIKATVSLVVLQNEAHLVDELVRHVFRFVRNGVERTISIEATLAKMLQQFQARHSIDSQFIPVGAVRQALK